MKLIKRSFNLPGRLWERLTEYMYRKKLRSRSEALIEILTKFFGKN